MHKESQNTNKIYKKATKQLKQYLYANNTVKQQYMQKKTKNKQNKQNQLTIFYHTHHIFGLLKTHDCTVDYGFFKVLIVGIYTGSSLHTCIVSCY